MANRSELDRMSRDELYQLAKKRNLSGRSQMDKQQLVAALSEKDPTRPKGRPDKRDAAPVAGDGEGVPPVWQGGGEDRPTTTSRAVWRGAITLGLITIPVGLYTAVEDRDISFRLLSAKDGSRVRYKRVSAESGEEVDWDDIVKGYEYEKGSYVVFTQEELERIPSDSIRAVDVVQFAPGDQIDPLYFDRSYYLAPDKQAVKAYTVLAEALHRSGRVGIAKVTIREKERLATLRAVDGVLVLETMNWPDEIRRPAFEQLGEPPRGVTGGGGDGRHPHRPPHRGLRPHPLSRQLPGEAGGGHPSQDRGRGSSARPRCRTRAGEGHRPAGGVAGQRGGHPRPPLGMTSEQLPPEAAQLYAAPLDEFVERRAALAAALQREGRTEEGAGVRRLRKPTLAAWVLNRVAGRRRDLVEALVATRPGLSQAAEVFEAGEQRRRLVVELMDEAGAELEEAGRRLSPGMREKLTETLLAATSNQEVGDSLLRGTLVREVQPESRWLLSGAGSRSGSRPRPGNRRQRDEAERLRGAARRLREEATAAQLRQRRLQAQAREAARAAEQAERRAAEAERDVAPFRTHGPQQR